MRYSCLLRVIIVPAVKKGAIPHHRRIHSKKQKVTNNKNHAKRRKIPSTPVHHQTHKGETDGKGRERGQKE
ncbi:hypothetical protein K457DRAFT_140629 [Linnemannia elongata AG-77]|uniref:Uncharacterized protein n=1 Tax=Linnemannia elongata AG-77 TaxID=1314771 RepID=A0A197JLK6_9FUNG|nr:hypothetical protein K457DRAFT_140629 [Linnemannia elongata AG-77]